MVPSKTLSVANGANYEVLSPAITGYETKDLNISGTMPTNDLIINVIYTKVIYTNTIDPNGGDLPDGTNPNPETKYNDTLTLPTATKNYTLTYELNDGAFVTSTSNPVNVAVKLLGYCKNSKACDSKDLITSNEVTITNGGDTYYAIWADKSNPVDLVSAKKDSTSTTNYTFAGYTNSNETSDKTYLTSPLTLTSDKTIYA